MSRDKNRQLDEFILLYTPIKLNYVIIQELKRNIKSVEFI